MNELTPSSPPAAAPSPRKVALVLSSGGARGYAHIGAIKALHERGYTISSVAGASMGALIGGLYCAGQLDTATTWFCQLTRREVLSLLDFSLSKSYLVKGDKVMRALKEMVPDTKIEQLPTPFRAIASDLVTQREVVFSKGSLHRAIRSSISMPSVFKPIKVAHHVLVDGGIVNPLPLNRAVRTEGDLLVSVNVSAPASEDIEEVRDLARKRERERSSLLSLQRFISAFAPDSTTSNYMTLLSTAMALQIQRNTVLMQKLTPPDIAINIPMNRFGVFDFDNAERIIRAGYTETLKVLDAFERENEGAL